MHSPPALAHLKFTDTWSLKENELECIPMGGSQAGRVTLLLCVFTGGWCHCGSTGNPGPVLEQALHSPALPLHLGFSRAGGIHSRNSNLVFTSFVIPVFIFSLHSVSIWQMFKNTCWEKKTSLFYILPTEFFSSSSCLLILHFGSIFLLP